MHHCINVSNLFKIEIGYFTLKLTKYSTFEQNNFFFGFKTLFLTNEALLFLVSSVRTTFFWAKFFLDNIYLGPKAYFRPNVFMCPITSWAQYLCLTNSISNNQILGIHFTTIYFQHFLLLTILHFVTHMSFYQKIGFDRHTLIYKTIILDEPRHALLTVNGQYFCGE